MLWPLLVFAPGEKGSVPGPRPCIRKGGHISVLGFEKGPLFTNF